MTNEPTQPSSPSGPLGTPVSLALQIGGGRVTPELAEAIAEVDRVHGDGVLPPISVVQVGGVGQMGSYIVGEDRRPKKITLNGGSREPRLTLLHEVGHLLDHTGIVSGGGFQSIAANPLLSAWWDAVRLSTVYLRAEAMKGKKSILVEVRPGKREWVRIDQAVVSDRLDPRELFARSYAQYIVVRGSNEALRHELQHALSGQNALKYPEQWDDEDFMPIALAFDELLRRLGWRT